MDVTMDGTDVRINDWMERQMDKLMDRQMDGQIWMNVRIDEWMERLMVYRWMKGWMDG